MPRLCMLSQYYPPEMGAPQGRLGELARHLTDQGWDIDVLTAMPNYPLGEVFDGYPRYWYQEEQSARGRILRVPLWPAQDGILQRMVCSGTFVASSSVFGSIRLPTPDFFLVESPPLPIAFAAWALATRFRRPYIANISDLWPSSLVRMGVVDSGPLLRMAEWVESRFYRHAAGVAGQTQGIVDTISATSPNTPVFWLPNGVTLGRFTPSPTVGDAIAQPRFVYAGLHGKAQGLSQVLDLAQDLPTEVGGQFLLVGDGPEKAALQERVRREGISRITFEDPVPRDRIPELLHDAQGAIVTLGSDLKEAIPSKIFEAMGAGLPLLMIADSEGGDIVQRNECGITVPQFDRRAAVEAFTQLATQPELRARMGGNGRRFVSEHFSREQLARDFSDWLLSLRSAT